MASRLGVTSKAPKKSLSGSLQNKVNGMGVALRRIQALYRKSYAQGGINNWTMFHEAQKRLKYVEKQYETFRKQLETSHPNAAKTMQKSLKSMAVGMKNKTHPQQTGRHAMAILQAAFQLDPTQKNAILSAYRRTIQDMESKLVAEQTRGAYKVGLLMHPLQTYHILTSVKDRDRTVSVKPGKGASFTLGVFLRDAKTGMPLAGTDVSVELLDGRTKKQLSTRLLHLLWSGAPQYVGHVALPQKSSRLIVQVTVNAFPLKRTQFSRSMLMSRTTFRFRALKKGGRLVFAKRKKQKLPAAQGLDLMRAMSLVGGQVSENGPYRVGLALVPLQTLYAYQSGSLKRLPRPTSPRAAQLIAFVQDRRTGLLVPNARIEVFVYWRTRKGNRHRHRFQLKPVFDGFPSYRAHIYTPPAYYDVRARIDPATLARFGHGLPGTFTTHFKSIEHPKLSKRFKRKK
jgi:hypothetical protein